VAAVDTGGTASATLNKDGSSMPPFSPSLLSGPDQLTLRANRSSQKLRNRRVSAVDKENLLQGHSYGAPSAIAARKTSKQRLVAGLILHDPALGMGYRHVQPIHVSTGASYTSDEYNRARVGEVWWR
jgi:pimeloyl-ACP methyl ester carboxylesterase